MQQRASEVQKLQLRAELAEMPLDQLEWLLHRIHWRSIARPNQILPPGDWHTWLLMSGRGWGKTRVGAEYTIQWAIEEPNRRIGVVAPTHDLLEKVCFEGESGLLENLPRGWLEQYNKGEYMRLKNGTTIFGYSAQDPERLRGPQFHKGWLDEVAAWDYPEAAVTMFNLCLRLGDKTQKIVTTTPKPFKFLRAMLEDEHTVVSRGSTYENRSNLSPMFLKEITQYEGTQLGKQELYGELLDFEEAGILKRSWFKIWPAKKEDGTPVKLPKFYAIVQSYDTGFKKDVMNDPTACTTWGVFHPDDKKSTFGVMLLDAWDKKLEYPELRQRVRDDYNKLAFGEDDKRVDTVIIEDKGSGISLIQDLNRAGVPVFAYNPGRADKIQRAHLASPFVKSGFIWLVESAKMPGAPRTWAEPFLDQVCRFGPDTFERDEEHDDYVDTLTQLVAWLRDSNWIHIPYDPKEDSVPEEPRARVNPYAV